MKRQAKQSNQSTHGLHHTLKLSIPQRQCMDQSMESDFGNGIRAHKQKIVYAYHYMQISWKYIEK